MRVGGTIRCAWAMWAAWLLAAAGPALAQTFPMTMTFDGTVPANGDYFEIPFTVPGGAAEIQIQHDDQSSTNILDWGLLGPDGFRGYGGGNTEDAIVGIDASSRSYLTGPITPGTWKVYVGKANVSEQPATYHVVVTLRDAPTLPPQTERTPYAAVAPLATGARWYAGDFHVHSQESGDASPSLEQIATYAESRGLDFVMISDHNTVSQLDFYAQVQAAHPDLLFIPGAEVTTYQGHAMAMGATQWVDHRLGNGGLTADMMADAVHAQGALFTINHPVLDLGSLCIGCAWKADITPDRVDGVEIENGGYSEVGYLFFDSAIAFWENLILEERHVPALGGSDDHQGGTGSGAFYSPISEPTTMVYASELSVQAILQGVREGRTVVKLQSPDDPMVEIESTDAPNGDTVVADTTTLRLRVAGGDGDTLYLVKDGARGDAIPVVGTPFEVERTVNAIGRRLLSGRAVDGGQAAGGHEPPLPPTGHAPSGWRRLFGRGHGR